MLPCLAESPLLPRPHLGLQKNALTTSLLIQYQCSNELPQPHMMSESRYREELSALAIERCWQLLYHQLQNHDTLLLDVISYYIT